MSDEPAIREVPVVRDTNLPADEVSCVVDEQGRAIIADGWVSIRCAGCGGLGQVPKMMTRGVDPDPMTGEFMGVCGECRTGKKEPYFANRHERRQAKRRRR